MPYPNEFSCRLKDPNGFKDPWARVKRKSKSMGKMYSVVRGTSKTTNKFEDQSYRYPKKTWTSADAGKHCKAHKGSSEAAGEVQRIDALVEASESMKNTSESETSLLTRFATRILNTPLMITQDRLNAILQVIGSRVGLTVDDNKIELEAASRDKRGMVNKQPGEQCIAVIEVYDTLVYRSRGISSLSGLSTYEQIGKNFDEALEDRDVDGVLFDIDTPGGEVSGVFELVDRIYEARGIKPIIAAVNDVAYSAGYAIASAADKVYVPRMGGVGSIGVIAVHTDRSKLNEKIGVKYTAIFAGAKKDDLSPHHEITEAAVQEVQLKVDNAYNLFVDTVARHRDISVEKVRSTEAATYQGNAGIQAGLVDAVLPWDGVLETFSSNDGGSSMPKKTKELKEQLDAILTDLSPDQEGELFSLMGFVSSEEVGTLKADMKTLQATLEAVKER
ncbi:MAG: S49 family peptidase, partial [Candidatus Heimdallarchaeota archaeon]|nr:S49 family peptidase [Candidatus Heimdallarchaeota archaeon]